MRDLALVVDGHRYDRWKSIRLVRRLDALCGTFELTSRDELPFQLVKDSLPCIITLGEQKLFTGFIEKSGRSTLSADFQIAGRDLTADLVDCSVCPLKEYRQQSLLEIATALAKPFGITVTSEVNATPFDLWRPNPDETIFHTLERAARRQGLLLRSNAHGQLVIDRVQGSVVGALQEGLNIIDAALTINRDQLYSEYIVRGQTAATGWNDSTVEARIRDPRIKRYRPLVITVEALAHNSDCEKRAQWEKAYRTAQAIKITMTTTGWLNPKGEIWDVNQLVVFESKRLGIKQSLLIGGVELSFGQDGSCAQLELMDSASYVSSPTEPKKPAEATW